MKLNFKENSIDRPVGSEHIMFGHLGNGITVWDTTKQDNTNFDYLKIAHIDKNRNIEFYVNDLDKEELDYINIYANTANPRISSSQAQLVFTEKAELKAHYFTFGIGTEYEDKYYKIMAHTSKEARTIMIDKFKLRWAFQYTEEQWKGQGIETLAEKWNWTELIV